jgi:hypothetical protein
MYHINAQSLAGQALRSFEVVRVPFLLCIYTIKALGLKIGFCAKLKSFFVLSGR